MLIASLVELSIPKGPMWQRHNVQLANFDVASLRVIWFPGPLLGCRHIDVRSPRERQMYETACAVLLFVMRPRSQPMSSDLYVGEFS